METDVAPTSLEAVFIKVAAERVSPQLAEYVLIRNVDGKDKLGTAALDVGDLSLGQHMHGQGVRNRRVLPRPQIIKPAGWLKLDLRFAELNTDGSNGTLSHSDLLGGRLPSVGQREPGFQRLPLNHVSNVNLVDGQVRSELVFSRYPSDGNGLIGGLSSLASLDNGSFGREERSSNVDNPKTGQPHLKKSGQRHEALCPNVSYRQPLALLLGFSLVFAAVPIGINMRGRDRGPMTAATMFLISFSLLNWGMWELLRHCF